MKNFTQEDFKTSKIDLHIHSNLSDGLASFEDIIKNAKQKGYKKISITDHNTIEGHKFFRDEILITGVEFDCWYKGVFIHLLAYGFDINNSELLSYMAKNKQGTDDVLPRLFSNRNVPKLINAIHNAGGVAILAHPACYWAINLEHFINELTKIGLDGIEVYYPYPRFRRIIKFHSEQKVLRIANKYPDLIKTGGTDFHEKEF